MFNSSTTSQIIAFIGSFLSGLGDSGIHTQVNLIGMCFVS